MIDIFSVRKSSKAFLLGYILFFSTVYPRESENRIIDHDAAMSSHYETEDEQSCDSQSTPVFPGQKSVTMSATETSSLLAGTEDANLLPAAHHMSLGRRVLIISTMAGAGLLSVSVYPFRCALSPWPQSKLTDS